MGSSFSQGRILLERPIPHAEHGFCSVLFCHQHADASDTPFFSPHANPSLWVKSPKRPISVAQTDLFPPRLFGMLLGNPGVGSVPDTDSVAVRPEPRALLLLICHTQPVRFAAVNAVLQEGLG